VNSAGVALLEPFLDASVENFDKTIAVNVRAVMVVSQVVAKNMIKRGVAGSIVNISSQAGVIGVQDHAAYCTSKGALDALTRTMVSFKRKRREKKEQEKLKRSSLSQALELGHHKIRVNSIQPTVVMTPMGRKAWSDPNKAAPMLARIPVRSFYVPQLFLF
jgi:NAD(P)-dependent dehydrogenase (short-subunit alcohol dehydrogenase family)